MLFRSLPETAYQADTTARVYEILSATAQRVLSQGCSVVLDAAFLRETERIVLADLARRHGARFIGLFLTADLATRISRIEQRRHDASDATREVAMLQQTYAVGAMDWHVVDAGGVPSDTLRRARAFTAGSEPEDVR